VGITSKWITSAMFLNHCALVRCCCLEVAKSVEAAATTETGAQRMCQPKNAIHELLAGNL